MEKLILKSGREKSLLNRHPWVFSGGVKLFPKAKNGSIVEVVDNKEQTLGYGFYAPNNQIVCKVFEFTTVWQDFTAIDYWLPKFRQALQLRMKMVVNDKTDCYRLIHAEGDFMPGVIVDIYGITAVMQIVAKGTELIEDVFAECLHKLGFSYIFRKIKINTPDQEEVEQATSWLGDTPPNPLIVNENGLRFKVDVEKGQKTGFFLDQRDSRQLLKNLSLGKSVLNTFCYTGGFSVYALAGGATEVHSVDISKDAVKMCNENVELNFKHTPAHTATAEDCFQYLKKSDKLYDIVVLDPPAFAKNTRSVPNATRGYKELNMLGLKTVKAGGLIFTYSCSGNIDKLLFQKIVFGAAADVKRNVRIISHLEAPADHPINIFHPESEYLKGLLLYVE